MYDGRHTYSSFQINISEFKRKQIEAITQLYRNGTAEENFTREVGVIFKKFQQQVVYEVKKYGWDGKDIGDANNPRLQWSFAGSLLYAVTVITTIGSLHSSLLFFSGVHTT